MDKEKLIACVYDRPCLWDTKFKGYHIRENANAYWREVAAELNESSDVVKAKWRNLRDTFRRELQKETNARPGEGSGAGSKWAYYANMLFLRDRLSARGRPQQRRQRPQEHARRPLAHAAEAFATIKIERDEYVEDAVGVEAAIADANGAESPPPPPTTTTRASTRGSRTVADVLKIRKRRARRAQRSKVAKPFEKIVPCGGGGGGGVETDADYHFLMSLLPYLRAVPDSTKLHVRSKLQQVFVDM